MSGVLELRGLRALGICGALPEEQQRRQPLEVDLDVAADLTTAADSDDLDDTIDYGTVCAAVEKVLREERFMLLERLARRIADVVLADDRVTSVAIAVRKLRPPVPQQLDTAGVRLTVDR